MMRLLNLLVIAALALTLQACASSGMGGGKTNPNDPFEGYNRRMFGFNNGVDKAVLKPVAKGYQAVVPSPVRTAVGNFFGNIGDAWSAVNYALQGNGEQFGTHVARVMTNSFLGLGGLIDIASDAGAKRKKTDFGATLGVWGVPAGPYLVLPLLGPSTVRDAAATPVDMKAGASSAIDHVRTRNATTALGLVDKRADLLPATDLLDTALDPYIMMRDLYLAKRLQDTGALPSVANAKTGKANDDKPPKEERFDLDDEPTPPKKP